MSSDRSAFDLHQGSLGHPEILDRQTPLPHRVIGDDDLIDGLAAGASIAIAMSYRRATIAE